MGYNGDRRLFLFDCFVSREGLYLDVEGAEEGEEDMVS